MRLLAHSSDTGPAGHLGMELFKSMAGIEMTRVPYKGSDLSMIDLMSGRIKGIAVTSATRSAAFPDFPTIAESGVAGYELESWYGILAPRKTPLAVIDILNAHINAVIALPEFKGRLAEEGAEAAPSNTCAEFRARFRTNCVAGSAS